MMTKLAQIKDVDENLYDIEYDYGFEKFVIWERNKHIHINGVYFTKELINELLLDGDIKIVNDYNNVFKNL
jgi:hypothetical protein